MPRSSTKKKKWNTGALARLSTDDHQANQNHQHVFERKLMDQDENVNPLEKCGNSLINLKQLQGGIFRASRCAQCGEGKLIMTESKTEGWASEFQLTCLDCNNSTAFWTSPPVHDGKARQINRALTLGMRAIGRGQSAAATLAGFLNLSPPINRGPWAKHTASVADKMQDVMDTTRGEIARRLKRQLLSEGRVPDSSPEDCLKSDRYIDGLIVDVAVSFDGSWKDRGRSSHHGVVAAISRHNGEILDIEYLCNHCSECNNHKSWNQDSEEFLSWTIEHLPDCPKNFTGSSQGMETEGVIRLYERSKSTGLRYTKFVGDGDCKSFITISRLQPYGPDVTITKEECVGHVQKRMGTRTRRTRDKWSGQKLSDGKGIGGSGRLTLARCDSFQYFYGECLRANKGNPEQCRKEVLAMLQHYSEDADHSNCPDRWCDRKYNSELPPIEKPLPTAIVEILLPIFKDLSDLKLLRNCSECSTQNANESFHSLLWRLIPKEGYNSAVEIMLGVQMAQLYYNQGRWSSNMLLFSVAGLDPSLRLQNASQRIDQKRLQNGIKSEQSNNKKRRLELRGSKRQLGFKSDKAQYKSASFHSGSTEFEAAV